MEKRLIDANVLKNLAEEVACCKLIDLDVLKIMIDHVSTINAEPCWIPCKEKMPEEKGEYLVTLQWRNSDDYIVDVSWFDNERKFGTITSFTVIAWMPLPKPYAERKDDERS